VAVVPGSVAVAGSAWGVQGFENADFVELDRFLDRKAGVKVGNQGCRLVERPLKGFVIEAVDDWRAGGTAHPRQTEIGRNLGDVVDEIEGALVAGPQGRDFPDLQAVEIIH